MRTNFTKKWHDSNFDQHGGAGHAAAVTWIDKNIFNPVELLTRQYL